MHISIGSRYPPFLTLSYLWVFLFVGNFFFNFYFIKMAPQGRGRAIVVSILLLGMLLHCGNVLAATYTVGDAGGWTFNVVGWPNGKTFRAGDVLGKYESLFSIYIYI